jgi:hypothetical protein
MGKHGDPPPVLHMSLPVSTKVNRVTEVAPVLVRAVL